MGQESVTKGKGLQKQITAFNFIANMKICNAVFDVLSPITNVLQGIQIDLGAASLIIANAIQQFGVLRNENVFNNIVDSVHEMCKQFNIPPAEPKQKSIRKRFFDEMGIDRVFNEVQDLKINIYFALIDNVSFSLNERFNEDNLEVLKQAGIFTHENLLKNKDIKLKASEISQLCDLYNLNPEIIAKEINDFKKIYILSESNIDISDLLQKNSKQKRKNYTKTRNAQGDDDGRDSTEEEELDENDVDEDF